MKKMIAVFFAGLLATGSAFANSVERYQAGMDYQIVNASKVNPANKLEVAEFFSYLCPHCRHFEPVVAKGRAALANDVSFERVPVTFQPGFDVAARAYWASKQLNIGDKTHSAIFAAIPQMPNNVKDADFAKVMAQASGLSADKIQKTMQSFSVANKVKQGEQLVQKNNINGVPALMVNGKYLVKMQEHAFEVVNFLLAKERMLNQ